MTIPFENICDGKYLNFKDSDGVSIALPVSIAGLPSRINLFGSTFALREEHHVTLVPLVKYKEKQNISDPKLDQSVLDDFCAFVRENPIEFIAYKNEFRLAEKPNKKTIVTMCQVSNLDKFFIFLNEKYKFGWEVPPTHVTLYTLDGRPGIFLADQDDLKTKTEIIEVPKEISKIFR